jgi:hypothetical protein
MSPLIGTAGPGMKRRVLLGLVPLLPLSSAWAQQKPLALPGNLPVKWYRVHVEDGGFTVELPGVPDHRIVNDNSPHGTSFALHSYSLEADGYSYVVQTALYPSDADVADPRRVLQAALDERAKALETRKWSKVDWRDIAGATTAESTGPLAGGKALRQLVLLKGRRFVSLGFMGPAGSVTGAEAERFFKSLKVKS